MASNAERASEAVAGGVHLGGLQGAQEGRPIKRAVLAGEHTLRPLASGLTDDGKPAPRLAISFGYATRAGALLAEHLEGLHGDGSVKPRSRPQSSRPNHATR